MANYIMGKNAILQFMENGKVIHQVFVNRKSKQDKKIREIVSIAALNSVPLRYVEKKDLDRITNHDHHQGVVAYIPAYKYADFDDILEYASEQKDQPFIIILDEIMDPYNFGAIIRTAVGAGVHGIVVPQRNQAEITSAVVKVSTGSVEKIKIAKVANLAQAIRKMQDKGFWIVGTYQDGKKLYNELDYDFPIGLVIGNEGKGISRLVKKSCDYLINIPMANKGINSLNASVSAAIVMYKIKEARGLEFNI